MRQRRHLQTTSVLLRENKIRILNVAGHRESKAPGIGARVERFLADGLRRLGHNPV
ncbi:MAG: hypothetical protein JO284_16645 [Planctomycetaceae bacterium]|nr:hypothetical protein [Planctomycetaceae bacterium]